MDVLTRPHQLRQVEECTYMWYEFTIFISDTHQEFTNGPFVVHKIEKVFSSTALDHAHKLVKLKGKAEPLDWRKIQQH